MAFLLIYLFDFTITFFQFARILKHSILNLNTDRVYSSFYLSVLWNEAE